MQKESKHMAMALILCALAFVVLYGDFHIRTDKNHECPCSSGFLAIFFFDDVCKAQ
jgi:hypothetical protein